jgi:hypothetical protein
MATVELTRAALRTPRAAAIAGILFAVLLGVAIVLVRQAVPGRPDEAGAWLTDPSRRTAVKVALNLIPISGVAFLWFMGALRDRVGAREDKFFATLFLGSGYLFVGMLFVLTALSAGLLSLAAAHGGRPSVEVWELGRETTYNIMVICAMRMAGVFAIATSTIGLRLRLFSRWLALVGFGVGLVCLLVVGAVPWLQLLFPLWILAVNIDSLVGSIRRGDPA